MKHYSVLLKESIDNLNIREDGIYVDATAGYAGHSSEILKKMKRGFLFAFDADEEALSYANEKLSSIGSNFKLIHANFSKMKEKLAEENITEVDGILFDLGLSSPQIDEAKRGFSFMKNAPLDMRMDRTQKISAFDIINQYDKKELMEIFFRYGEEQTSRQIAQEIVKERQKKPIETTEELVNIIHSAVKDRYFYEKHPERQIFQAIRIEVNNELKVLESVLPDAIKLLKKGGRLCVITFHSLEDRIVKQAFKKYSEENEFVKGLPEIPEEYKPLIKIINKKPILPSEEEIKENSRSKSAKLRVIERI